MNNIVRVMLAGTVILCAGSNLLAMSKQLRPPTPTHANAKKRKLPNIPKSQKKSKILEESTSNIQNEASTKEELNNNVQSTDTNLKKIKWIDIPEVKEISEKISSLAIQQEKPGKISFMKMLALQRIFPGKYTCSISNPLGSMAIHLIMRIEERIEKEGEVGCDEIKEWEKFFTITLMGTREEVEAIQKKREEDLRKKLAQQKMDEEKVTARKKDLKRKRIGIISKNIYDDLEEERE